MNPSASAKVQDQQAIRAASTPRKDEIMQEAPAYGQAVTSPAKLYAKPRPLMRRNYLVRSNKALAVLSSIDAVLRVVSRRRTTCAPVQEPRRILVANWAHIGDVLTSLPTVRALRERFPSAKIDLLVSRVGRVAVEQSDLYDTIYTVDHVVLNRSACSRWTKLWSYLDERRRFLRAATAENYDVAIDLYPHFPPASPLFWRIGVPVRCGFTSGGFGPLLTHPVKWSYQDKPIGQYGRDLIGAIWPAWAGSLPSLAQYRPGYINAFSPVDREAPGAPYVVVHTGAGAHYKEWPESNWIDLLKLWGLDAPLLVFCGVGPREGARARRIAEHSPTGRTMLFLDRGWAELTRLLAEAVGLICLESSSAHLAAAFSLPTVAIYSGTNDRRLWGPDNVNARVLSAPTGCAPCHRGCEAMACVRGVSPGEVLDAVRSVMRVNAAAAPHLAASTCAISPFGQSA